MNTRKELKGMLHSYEDIKAEREQIEAELDRLADPRGAVWDDMPKSPGTGDPVPGIAAKRDALREQYEALRAQLIAAQLAVEGLIEDLDPFERKLMRHRYIECMTWEEVCEAVGYSWRQTHYYHARALNKILEKYQKEAQAIE